MYCVKARGGGNKRTDSVWSTEYDMFLEPGFFFVISILTHIHSNLGWIVYNETSVCTIVYCPATCASHRPVSQSSICFYQWPARYPLLLIVYILFNHFNCELGAQSSVFHDVIFDNRHIHLHTTFLQVSHTRLLMSNQNSFVNVSDWILKWLHSKTIHNIKYDISKN